MLRTSVLAVALAVVGGSGCPSKKCTPSTCMGCCSANDTCETGTSASACGAGASMCDRCVGEQLCVAGRCEGVVGSGGGGAGGGGAGSAAGGAADELSGTFRVLYGWDGDGGTGPAFADPPRATVGVWYRDGGNPDFKRGFANADGTFAVRELPPGEVTLQLNRNYFVTSQRRLDLDFLAGGRQRPLPTTASTLHVTVRGLEPVGPTNTCGFFFDHTPTSLTNLENFGVPRTPVGATSIDNVDVAWRTLSDSFGHGLPDATKGDKGWALQFGFTTFDGGSTSQLSRVGEFNPVTLPNGGEADAVATVAATAGTPYTVAFDRAAFVALRGSLGRDTGAGRFGFSRGTSPAPESRPQNASITLASASALETEPLPSVSLAAPFPASWSQVVTAQYVVSQPRSANPDGGAPVSFSGQVGLIDLAQNVPATVSVRLGPVRGAQVQARNFIEDQTGIGLTPTFSWMAPTTGTVSTYRLAITRLPLTGTATERWSVWTTNTAVTLPPGILTTGGAYVFELIAFTTGRGTSVIEVPYGFSVVVSGVMRP